jgi:putative membrane protein
MKEGKQKTSDQKTNVNEKETPPKDLMLKSALVRTNLAAERSLMAWIRTSISLYAFGFSIITFFDYLDNQVTETRSMTIPIMLGFTLIGIGIISLILAMIEHRDVRKHLYKLGLPVVSKYSLPIYSSVALIIIGILALVAVIIHISY